MIRQRGKKWYVISRNGRNLGGPYNSREAAVARLQTVEYFKHQHKRHKE